VRIASGIDESSATKFFAWFPPDIAPGAEETVQEAGAAAAHRVVRAFSPRPEG
jgi:hypothetical protein